jgi:hypothetical protein
MAKPARFTGEVLAKVEALIREHGVSGAKAKLAEKGVQVARNTLIEIAKRAGITTKAGRRSKPPPVQPRNAYSETFHALYPDFPTG